MAGPRGTPRGPAKRPLRPGPRFLWIVASVERSAEFETESQVLHRICTEFGPRTHIPAHSAACRISGSGAPFPCRKGLRRGRTERPETADPDAEASRRFPASEDRGDPGRTFRRHRTRRKTRELAPEPKARSTWKAQIPQRIWMRGRSSGQPERRPLAMGASASTVAKTTGEVSAKLTEGAQSPRSACPRPQKFSTLRLAPPPSRRVPRRSTSPVVFATVEERFDSP